MYRCDVEAVPKRKTILILEDDANDALLIRRAFTNSETRAFVCRNTSEARAYLLGSGMYADRERFPFPGMFVSDLRLGEESGVHFLEWLRGRDELKDLPVIVISGAASPKDIREVTRLGASRVLRKPGNAEALQGLLLRLADEVGSRSREPEDFSKVKTSVPV
jgi:CheY-like chemotaxis protein